MSTERFIGQPMRRQEDRRLLSGKGRYVADIRLPRAVHVAFARSTMAHGRIRCIDVTRAKVLPGVLAVFTAADFAAHLAPIRSMLTTPPGPWQKLVEHNICIPDQPLIANNKVRYVGEPYAVVVAESRYIAEDALEIIECELDPLPTVGDPVAAMECGCAQVHDGCIDNVVARFRYRKGSTPAGPLHYIRRCFHNHRFLALPIECRGVMAEYDSRGDAVTMWSATQIVHIVRAEVARQLQLPEARVRCIAPDVGGGFGVKGHVYCEDIIVPFLARLLERPVVWIEDRQEHLLNSSHSRDDIHDAEILFDGNGTIHGLKDDLVFDSGAYTPSGIASLANIAAHICGPYRVPYFEFSATAVVTNKAPNAPYRGTGRPEGSFVIERLIDLMARELGLDPIEARRHNMIRADEMPYATGIPYRDGVPIVYDGGDYQKSLNLALQALGGVEAFRERQKQAWREGRYIGLGVACYVEGTGVGPFESATVRINPGGDLFVATGACSSGQGHETVFAQVTADEWGLKPQDVTVQLSDTGLIATGFGSVASRTAVTSSAAIRKASAVLREKVLAIGAHLLECDVADVEMREGMVVLKGVSKGINLKDIARAAYPGWMSNRPPGISAGLEATEYFEPKTVTWAYGTHAAVIEILADTGDIRIHKYVVAHDAGVLINPMIANGQIMGGVCQGIGGCLLEKVVYDEQGQNLTGSLMDYLVPVAAQMPPIEILHTETPSPQNELGIKGLGEGGVVGPPGVITNGVCDALRPLGFEINQSFFSQADVVAALSEFSRGKPSMSPRA